MVKKLFSQEYTHKQKLMSKMSHSESKSEPDFSHFAINSLSTFVPIFSESKSESDAESYFNSVFMNLGICVFLSYIYALLNKLADDLFLSIAKTESIVMQQCKYNTCFLLAYHYPKSLFLSSHQILLL